MFLLRLPQLPREGGEQMSLFQLRLAPSRLFFADLFKSLLSPAIPLRILPYHINDPAFADAVIEEGKAVLTT
jgi:hypothetical protein